MKNLDGDKWFAIMLIPLFIGMCGSLIYTVKRDNNQAFIKQEEQKAWYKEHCKITGYGYIRQHTGKNEHFANITKYICDDGLTREVLNN